jgi:hypothetical protein
VVSLDGRPRRPAQRDPGGDGGGHDGGDFAAAATTEAIQSEVTGLVAEVNAAGGMGGRLAAPRRRRCAGGALRAAARTWVEENYDARRNAARLQAASQRSQEAAASLPKP